MNIKKQFTTVTRFSKLVALILLVSLPFIGFYAGIKFLNSKNTGPTTQVSATNFLSNSGSRTNLTTASSTPTQAPVQNIPRIGSCTNNACLFVGKITDINWGCTYDNVCIITVDTKKVTFGGDFVPLGGSKEPTWGKIIGKLESGREVEVYAGYSRESNEYSTYGNKDFYIKVK